jgi:hypothetical protein
MNNSSKKIAVYTTAKAASEVQFAVDVGSDGVRDFQDLFGEEDEKMFADMTGGFTDELISQFDELLTDGLGAILQCAGTKTMTLELYEPDLAAYLPSGLDLARGRGAGGSRLGVRRSWKVRGSARWERPFIELSG